MEAAPPERRTPSREHPSPVRQGLAEAGRPSTALPIEIGFLAQYGHSPENLRDAAIMAELEGVTADEFLLKHGLITEDDFYRALAAELDLRFIGRPRLARAAVFPDSILTGVAPLAQPEGCFLLAPRGANLVRLLSGRKLEGSRLCMTTPSRLAEAVFASNARAIAYRAAHDLPDSTPEFSSRAGASIMQIAALSVLALTTSFAAPQLPGLVLTLLGASVAPLFSGMIVLRLAASILPNPVEPRLPLTRIDDAALPTYTVIIALYREKRVASRLVAALSRLDYPPAKLDIKLVLEADDTETLVALNGMDLSGFLEVLVAPPGAPRTKPRALNVALPLARGRFTVIYDAEDVPHPGQLRSAAAAFSRLPPDVACLQARLSIDNTDDSWLTRLFTIEYAALFDVFNPGLAEIGSPVPLGGTSNHFRTSVLQDLRGWDAWNVTEDADLGIRIARFGYRVADLPSSTFEEAPSTLTAWMSQRTRWMKGFMQTTISHSRMPWRAFKQLGFWRFYGAATLTLGTVLSALAYPILTGLFLVTWLGGASRSDGSHWAALWASSSLVLFLSGAAAMTIPACVALKRRRLWRLLPWVLLLPFYYGLVSLAAWRAVWELATAPFRWNKTAHGLARTSRTGLF